MMNVTLSTADRNTVDLCVQVLKQTHPGNYELSVVYPQHPVPEAGVYIWDYREGQEFDAKVIGGQPPYHVLIVESKYLDRFKSAIELGVMVVLKPATRAALAAWLGQAALASENLSDAVPGPERWLRILTDANLRLQRNEHDRMQCLAGVLHDLRIPLTTNRGYCELLLDHIEPLLLGSQRVLLRHMQHSLERMSEITSAAFHDLVGVDAKRGSVFRESDIEECVYHAIDEIRLLANEKCIQLRTHLQAPDEAIYFDPLNFGRVIVNVLHNACKFAAKHGKIEIRGYPFFSERRSSRIQDFSVNRDNKEQDSLASKSFRIDIYNTGPKINADDLTDFGSPAKLRTSCENGLGLAICRRIVDEHQGKLWAENRTDGPVISLVIPFRPDSIAGRLCPDGGYASPGSIAIPSMR